MEKEIRPTSQTKRAINCIIDSVIFIFFGPVFYNIINIVFGSVFFEDLVRSLNVFVFVLPYIIYYLLFESIWQKTPAKFITKTRVILENGSKPKFNNILIRTLLRLVPFDWLTYLSSKNPIGWHDRFSKTLVVSDDSN